MNIIESDKHGAYTQTRIDKITMIKYHYQLSTIRQLVNSEDGISTNAYGHYKAVNE